MEKKSLLNNSEIMSWAKKIIIGLIGIIVVREIIALIFFHSVFNQVMNGLGQQGQSMASFQQRAENHMKEVEEGMNSVMKEMEEGKKHVEASFDSFNKDFAESSAHLRELDEKTANYNSRSLVDKMMSDSRNADIEMDKMRKRMADDQAKEEKKKLAIFMKSIKPYIECEKKMFGSSSFNPEYPYDYNAFHWGLPEACKKKS